MLFFLWSKKIKQITEQKNTSKSWASQTKVTSDSAQIALVWGTWSENVDTQLITL